MMSSRRSRKGGSEISIVFRRKSRSWRKRPARHFFVQVRIRRGNDPDIRVQSFRGADALELAGLDHAQQFRLLIHRDVRDLVHEERALVRQLEAAGAIRLRIGECAFHVPEQFALENSFGQAAHVHRDHDFATRGCESA